MSDVAEQFEVIKPFQLGENVRFPTDADAMIAFVDRYATGVSVIESHPEFVDLPRLNIEAALKAVASQEIVKVLIEQWNRSLQSKGFLVGNDKGGYYYLFQAQAQNTRDTATQVFKAYFFNKESLNSK